MKRIFAIVGCLALASGCTSSLRPVGLNPNLGTLDDREQPLGKCSRNVAISLQDLMAPETVEETTVIAAVGGGKGPGTPGSRANSRLDWLSCEMLAQSMKNFHQSQTLSNRSEWRDVPLIGSAITVGALVLFGQRGDDGNLTSGETDVIEGFALGTASYTLLARYANPEQASQLLYASARGHRCLAEHGQLIATYGRNLIAGDDTNLEIQLRVVVSRLREEAIKIGTPADAAGVKNVADARTALERAEQALAFRVRQRRAREIAPARLYLTSFDFGMAMTRKARRQPVDIADIQSTLRKTIELQRENAGLVPSGATDSAADAQAKANGWAGKSAPELTARAVSLTNRILEETPNIAPLVEQMKLCTDLALIDGTRLPEPEISYGPDIN